MKLNKIKKNKRVAALLFTAIACSAGVFAASSSNSDFGLNTHVQTIITFLESPWVKGIACIALVVECFGLITAGRQEPGMFKKFIPWISGTVLFMAAGTITKAFFNISTGSLNYSAAPVVREVERG